VPRPQSVVCDESEIADIAQSMTNSVIQVVALKLSRLGFHGGPGDHSGLRNLVYQMVVATETQSANPANGKAPMIGEIKGAQNTAARELMSRQDALVQDDFSRPLVVSPRQACQLLSVGLTRLYELLKAGELDSLHVGRSRRVTVASIHAFIERQLATSRHRGGKRMER
jgi:excisionase family DNA binding protein